MNHFLEIRSGRYCNLLDHGNDEFDIPLNTNILRWRKRDDSFVRERVLFSKTEIITVLKFNHDKSRIIIATNSGHIYLCDKEYKELSSVFLAKERCLHISINNQGFKKKILKK